MTKIFWFRIRHGDLCVRLFVPPTFELGLGFHIALIRYEVHLSLLFISVSYNWDRGIKQRRYANA